ncbi:MAG: formate dehydrogenase accessory sulfurtransferase FdhD [Agriterribacter sp.]
MEVKDTMPGSVTQMPVTKVNGSTSALYCDVLSVEEPLEISIAYGPKTARQQKNISVTMRTPGNDAELATGFLFTEGIITSYDDVIEAYHTNYNCTSQKQNSIRVALAESFMPSLNQADRNFYTTSSCGVCGKSAIQSIKTVSKFKDLQKPALHLDVDMLYHLSENFKTAQNDFASTGGIHASGIFTVDGELVLLREDVGRHNALDKLIGNAFINRLLPLNCHILLLSGRASFELIQKAAMAGINIVAAIGAPSSLAVSLAREFDITLLGFLRKERFNIYHIGKHVQIPYSI